MVAASFPAALPAPFPAPYLVWPVARREFYRALSFALLPTLAWGAIVFGWRALFLLLAALAGASLSHTLLKRFTRRGKILLYPHAVTGAMILAALALPTWPAWTLALLAFLLPPTYALIGGPGKERTHVAVLYALLLQFLLLPALPNHGLFNSSPYALLPGPALLARDRLLMGDVRNQAPAPLYRWPTSLDLQGNDAVRMTPPAQTAGATLDRLGDQLAPPDGPTPVTVPLGPMRETLDVVLVSRLPAVELVLLGAFSGRTGLVSLAGILAGGLYLAYRYILRPRSVALFLITYGVALLLFALPPATLAHADFHQLATFLRTFPIELASLVATLFLTGDAPFAAVFILALPGTEPLTPRGRHVFLVAAALTGALLTRYSSLPLPACTAALALFMPLAPTFDRLFAKRSWLNRLRA